MCVTSNFEGDLLVLLEQKINMEDPKYLHYENYGVQTKHNNQCFICKNNIENITHLQLGGPNISAYYNLPLLHDPIAATVYKALHR